VALLRCSAGVITRRTGLAGPAAEAATDGADADAAGCAVAAKGRPAHSRAAAHDRQLSFIKRLPVALQLGAAKESA
jgi:hypothetical protein